ncbi:MAG: hypothetical protein GXP59_03215 [Deltaproteobacteria bacterium]|nr:hypothetical protein [Deltaproteobacteria bacterium]
MKKLTIFVFIFLLIGACDAFAKDYILSLGKLPLYIKSPDKGILIKVIKAMDREYKGGHFIIKVYPLRRSIENVINGEADFHFPTIGSKIWGKETGKHEEELRRKGLFRSTASLTETHFALFSNKGKPPINEKHLERYKIETDAGHTFFFGPYVRGTTCLSCSIKKLSAGRIDGLIFAAREIDHIIKKLHITNVRRQNFRIFGSKFILPVGKKGEKLDRLLQGLIYKMIKDGTLRKAAGQYSSYFIREFGSDYLPKLSDIPKSYLTKYKNDAANTK